MSEHTQRTEVVSGVEVTVQVVEGHEPASAPIKVVADPDGVEGRTVEVAGIDGALDFFETVVCTSPEAADQWDGRMWLNHPNAPKV